MPEVVLLQGGEVLTTSFSLLGKPPSEPRKNKVSTRALTVHANMHMGSILTYS